MSSNAPARSPSGAKSRLFCQRCGHESHLDGDWEVQSTPDGTVVSRCPVCDHVVDERPATDGGSEESDTDGDAPDDRRIDLVQ